MRAEQGRRRAARDDLARKPRPFEVRAQRGDGRRKLLEWRVAVREPDVARVEVEAAQAHARQLVDRLGQRDRSGPRFDAGTVDSRVNFHQDADGCSGDSGRLRDGLRG